MKDHITLTIPRIPSDLREAAGMLNGIANSIEPLNAVSDPAPTPAAEPEQPATLAPTHPDHIDGSMTTEPDPAAAFGGGAENPTAATTPAAPDPVNTRAESQGADTVPPTATTEQAASSAPAGVDLDADGLPWDERIHAGSRKKLAKTNQWKKKRGVDDATVAAVEAELRQLMAVPTEQPTTPAPVAPPATTEQQPAVVAPPTAPAPVAPPATTEQPAAPASGADYTGWGWQEFMSEFMKQGKTVDQALAACQTHGVESTALLASRPDLIPQVAKTLFEG